jgi:hypothetical protein
MIEDGSPQKRRAGHGLKVAPYFNPILSLILSLKYPKIIPKCSNDPPQQDPTIKNKLFYLQISQKNTTMTHLNHGS